MANFFVNSKYWEAAVVKGQPLNGGGNSIEIFFCYASTVVTFKLFVDVEYDWMGPYDHLVWRIGYHDASGVRTVNQAAAVPPAPLTLVVPATAYMGMAPVGPSLVVQLYGCLGAEEPPDGDRLLIANVAESPIFFDPKTAAPTRYRRGGEWGCSVCPTGGMSCDKQQFVEITTDYGYGNMAAFYDLPVYPANDNNAILTGFTYVRMPLERRWVFSALPGNMTFSQGGVTHESPARTMYNAMTKPASGGSRRVYLSDNSTDDFVTEVAYGTSFQPIASGYREDIGSAQVYYDSSKRIVRVQDGGAVHEYDYTSSTQVIISANTEPLTRMICTHSDYQVSQVTTEAYLPLLGGWVAIGRASISWSGDLITSIHLSPNDTTTTFEYYGDGTLASFEGCDGRACTLQYYPEEAI